MKTKIVLGFTLGLAVLAAPFAGAVKIHNWQMSQLQDQIGALPHPTGSKLVARHGEIANFGNGNHLDFWAVELREFSGSRAALQRVYSGRRVPVPHSEDNDYDDVRGGTQPVEIEVLPSPLSASYRVPLGNGEGWDLKEFAGKRGLYLVQVVNSGPNDGLTTLFDWRGN